MGLRSLWFCRFALWFLLFAEIGIIYNPAEVWGQTGMVVPDDALVYEGKISHFYVTKDTTSITFDGTITLKSCLHFNDEEVLTGSHVQFAIPTLNYLTLDDGTTKTGFIKFK